MSNQYQQNMNFGVNKNLNQPNFNSNIYFSKGEYSKKNMNVSLDVVSGKNPGFISVNNNNKNSNHENNLEEYFTFRIKFNKLKHPKTGEKEFSNISKKFKGIYKKNIIKQKSNKSNKSNSNSNSDSNTTVKQIKVNTVNYKKNINRNLFNKNSQQNLNQNQNNIQQNQVNQMSQTTRPDTENIKHSNIESNKINNNNNNEIINLNQIQPNIINSQNNNFLININQNNINSNIAFQNDSNQDSINLIRNEQVAKKQFNQAFGNKGKKIYISMENIQNKNQEKMNQIQDNNNKKKIHSQIQNNNQVNKINIKSNNNYSFDRYTKAAMTGIKNLGNTSYANSVLQLLCCIKSFSSYFLNPKNGAFFKNNLEKYSLSFVFHRLCNHLYPYPEKQGREIYTPNAFMFILGSLNLAYKDNEEKDPNMLINFILYRLIEEFTDDKKENNFSDININIACNRESTINIGLKNFVQNNNKSVVFNYFNWFEIKETKCMKCSNDLFYFQTFSTFELDLYLTAKHKEIKSIKIEDCLKFYSISKIKKNFCYFCQGYHEVATTKHIYSSPNIFLFLINLEDTLDDNDEYNNINFVVEKKINLRNFIENKLGPSIYELNGMVLLNKNENKYETLCISPVDYKWYLYDDDKVKQFDYDDFMEYIYKNELDYQPRILLYKSNRN